VLNEALQQTPAAILDFRTLTFGAAAALSASFGEEE
jgi:hypothetical protein